MDLSRAASPHEVGDWVRIDYGDFKAHEIDPLVGLNGFVGEIVGHDVHMTLPFQEAVDYGRSINLIKLSDGRIVRVHWANVRRLSPLEALARQTD